MAAIKRLTILHSNDLHGDFLAEEIDQQLIGGVSMLYVNPPDIVKRCRTVIFFLVQPVFCQQLAISRRCISVAPYKVVPLPVAYIRHKLVV